MAAPRWLRDGSTATLWRLQDASLASPQYFLWFSSFASLYLHRDSAVAPLRFCSAPRWFHGWSSAASQWVREFRLRIRGGSLVAPRCLHCSSEVAHWWLRVSHGAAISRIRDGSTAMVPRCFRGGIVIVLWHLHGDHTVALLRLRGSSMVVARCLHWLRYNCLMGALRWLHIDSVAARRQLFGGSDAPRAYRW